MDAFEFVIALISLVGAFVTLWIFVLYQRKDRKPRSAGSSEYSLQELTGMAQSMTERIDTLESILDAEIPGWRDKHEQA